MDLIYHCQGSKLKEEGDETTSLQVEELKLENIDSEAIRQELATHRFYDAPSSIQLNY